MEDAVSQCRGGEMEARKAQDGRRPDQQQHGKSSKKLMPDGDHLDKKPFKSPTLAMITPKREQSCVQEDLRAMVVQSALALTLQKRREETLLQERHTFQKERDSWTGMYSDALASMKALEAEMEIEKRKREEEGANVELSQVQLGALGGLLLQKNSELATLRMQLAYMNKAKRDGLVEKQQQAQDAASAMELLKKEVDGKVSALSSLQVEILEWVSALTADVKAFQGDLGETAETAAEPNAERARSDSRMSGDKDRAHADCRQNSSSKPAIVSGAQEDNQDGLWKLELVADSLVTEIESVQLVMTKVAKDWKEAAHKKTPPAPAAERRGVRVDGGGEDPRSKRKLKQLAREKICGHSCGDVIANLHSKVAALVQERDALQAALHEVRKDGSSGRAEPRQGHEPAQETFPATVGSKKAKCGAAAVALSTHQFLPIFVTPAAAASSTNLSRPRSLGMPRTI